MNGFSNSPKKEENRDRNIDQLKCLGCTQWFKKDEGLDLRGITETHFRVLPSAKKIKNY